MCLEDGHQVTAYNEIRHARMHCTVDHHQGMTAASEHNDGWSVSEALG